MKAKTYYVCSACEYRSPKWFGRCPSCNAWGTMEEQTAEETSSAGRSTAGKQPASRTGFAGSASPAVRLDELELPVYMRSSAGYAELDRVLGGGLVNGSVVLLSGEPGIGKSTLLMQISEALGRDKRVLYISGEESLGQLKLRAKRLSVQSPNLYIMTESNIERILDETERCQPDVLIIDSIQTVYSDNSAAAPGSVTQVREGALSFIGLAKSRGISVILVGHVNKEGGIAGPKVLEHMVDAVLYFEGEQTHAYRIIRAVKNRFGSTNEIGVFEMTEAGLSEVPNPSEALLAGRPKNVSGNCAVCIMEGSRPIVAEVQALVCTTAFPSPRRTSNGIDYNRLYLLLAVLEKRLGLRFSAADVYLNVIGGLRLDEPASDLPAVLALVSSLKDIPIPDDLIAAGEIGLSGECRAVSNADQRIREAERLGFSRILVPARTVGMLKEKHGIDIVPVRSVFDAVAAALKAPAKN